MHRFRWLSRSRTESIAHVLGDLSTDWWSAWSLSDLPHLTWHAVTDRDLVSRSGWLSVHATDGHLGMRIDQGSDGALGRQLAGIQDDAESMTAIRIGRAAQEALAKRILGIDANSTTCTTLRPVDLSPDWGEPSRGGGVFRSTLGPCSLLLAIDACVADRLAPPAAPSPQPLVLREHAVDSQLTRIQLRLDLGELSLSELQQLTEGEVLASHVPLDTPFTVALSPTNRLIAAARLGRSREHRAALLDSFPNPSTNTTP